MLSVLSTLNHNHRNNREFPSTTFPVRFLAILGIPILPRGSIVDFFVEPPFGPRRSKAGADDGK